jgi:hypothetical protein
MDFFECTILGVTISSNESYVFPVNLILPPAVSYLTSPAVEYEP